MGKNFEALFGNELQFLVDLVKQNADAIDSFLWTPATGLSDSERANLVHQLAYRRLLCEKLQRIREMTHE